MTEEHYCDSAALAYALLSHSVFVAITRSSSKNNKGLIYSGLRRNCSFVIRTNLLCSLPCGSVEIGFETEGVSCEKSRYSRCHRFLSTFFSGHNDCADCRRPCIFLVMENSKSGRLLFDGPSIMRCRSSASSAERMSVKQVYEIRLHMTSLVI
jgi:hypothetical protein